VPVPATVRLTALVDPAARPPDRRLVWLAADDGGVTVGSARLELPGRGDAAGLDLAVHPAHRRAGTGSLLLAAARAAAAEQGQRRISVRTAADGPGEPFLAARGFRAVLGLTYARLVLGDGGPAVPPAAPAHPGYRLVSWQGTVPAALAHSFAASRRAMDDMPMGDSDRDTTPWDVERVLAVEAAVAARGELLTTVVAVDTADGSVAGFTELVVPGDGLGDGQHYGTGVLPGHRGRGLARRMKTESIRLARAHHPQLSGLLTDTADGNAPMRAVNDALGYRPTHRTVEYALDLA